MNYPRAIFALNLVAVLAALGIIYGFARATCWVLA